MSFLLTAFYIFTVPFILLDQVLGTAALGPSKLVIIVVENRGLVHGQHEFLLGRVEHRQNEVPAVPRLQSLEPLFVLLGVDNCLVVALHFRDDLLHLVLARLCLLYGEV